jgi:antirestriction protein ArdC
MADKNQSEQHAAERQKELLAQGLERARAEGGFLLNQAGKTAPRLYPRDAGVSAFNALILALHSDRGGYRTNLYTPYPGAKKRGESVQTGEKGVPFIWYRWNEYRSKSDEGRTITKKEYDQLPQEQKADFSPVRDRQVRTLFNIEQTTLPLTDPEAFAKAVKEHGTLEDRSPKDDKQTRIDVNILLGKISENLVPIHKDGTGVARYDSAKDVVHIPAQKHYPDYASYVQDAFRQVVSATGHPGRMDRPGTAVEGMRNPEEGLRNRERLVVELASAVKMNQLGLPARLSPESLPLVEGWTKSLRENPVFLSHVEANVNKALSLVDKAERGQKVEMRQLEPRQEQPSETVSAKMTMIRDDEGKWAMFLKPEGEKGFAVYPDKADLGRFFNAVKNGGDKDGKLKQELAQKYYALATAHPEMKVDLFGTREKDIDFSAIRRVSIIQQKTGPNPDDPRKIMCYLEVRGMDQPVSREVSPSQYQRLWLTDDKEEYKRNLAATLFADLLKQKKEVEEEKKEEEEKRRNSPEQKAKEEREEKAKEELTRAETGVVAAIVGAGIAKDQVEERSRGFHR